MKNINIILIIIFILMLISPVVAQAGNITASRGVTANGPYNLLIGLGFEQVIPLQWALLFYNWISVMLLFFLIGMASQRNYRFFGIIAVILAAVFAFFGWLNDPNPTKVWGLIGLTGLVAAGIYLKDTNKEKWGSGGPGITLLNFVFFIILLQSSIGLVNSTAIWEHNTAVTPSQYQNVDLGTQMGGLSNTGGLLSGAITTAVALLEMGILILQMILTIILSIVAFSVVLFLAFPWLAGNPMILVAIGTIQVIVWLIYAWFMFTIIYKPMPDGGYI